jgi:hypothetical protein
MNSTIQLLNSRVRGSVCSAVGSNLGGSRLNSHKLALFCVCDVGIRTLSLRTLFAICHPDVGRRFLIVVAFPVSGRTRISAWICIYQTIPPERWARR